MARISAISLSLAASKACAFVASWRSSAEVVAASLSLATSSASRSASAALSPKASFSAVIVSLSSFRRLISSDKSLVLAVNASIADANSSFFSFIDFSATAVNSVISFFNCSLAERRSSFSCFNAFMVSSLSDATFSLFIKLLHCNSYCSLSASAVATFDSKALIRSLRAIFWRSMLIIRFRNSSFLAVVSESCLAAVAAFCSIIILSSCHSNRAVSVAEVEALVMKLLIVSPMSDFT